MITHKRLQMSLLKFQHMFIRFDIKLLVIAYSLKKQCPLLIQLEAFSRGPWYYLPGLPTSSHFFQVCQILKSKSKSFISPGPMLSDENLDFDFQSNMNTILSLL